jgi:hypothetical protein
MPLPPPSGHLQKNAKDHHTTTKRNLSKLDLYEVKQNNTATASKVRAFTKKYPAK